MISTTSFHCSISPEWQQVKSGQVWFNFRRDFSKPTDFLQLDVSKNTLNSSDFSINRIDNTTLQVTNTTSTFLIKSEHHTSTFKQPPNLISPSPKKQLLAASYESTIKIYDSDNFQERREFNKGAKTGGPLDPASNHVGEITVLGWFPSGEVLFSGATDTQVKIWNLMDGTCVQTLAGVHKRGITQILPIEKGRNLLTCGSDGLCVLWECGSGRAVHVYTSANPSNIAIVHAKLELDTEPKSNQPDQKSSHLHFEKNHTLLLIFDDGFQQSFDLRSGRSKTSRKRVYSERMVNEMGGEETQSNKMCEEVTCAISEHVGSESGCVNGVKFSNSRVTALARLEKLGVLAGFRDGTLILITPDLNISQVFSGTDCKEIISIQVQSETDFMCLTVDGSLRHYTVNACLDQESSVQSM